MKKWFGRAQTLPSAGKTAATTRPPFDLSLEPKPGFLGNLDSSQYTALQQFKQRYEDKVKSFVDQSPSIAYSKEEEISLNKVHYPVEVKEDIAAVSVCTSHQFTEIDSFLLRILRARSFDLVKATLMLDEYLKWRTSFHVEEICREVKFPFVPKLRSVYPHGYHGVDRIGRPVYIERVGKSDMGAALKIAPIDHLLAYWVQQYEYVRRVVLPACSIAAGRRIEQGISIIDLSGLGFSHCGAQSRTVLRQIAKLSQDYFPEMLGCMVIVNAPAVFTPVWSFARTLIDERTVSKMTLLTSRSTHWKQYLQELVAPDQLPEFLGGTSSDKQWDLNTKGPWRDPKILEQLEARFPSIPQQLLYFDVHAGDVASLSSLDGLVAPTMTIEDRSPSLEALDAEEVDEGKAFYKLSESGVNVVE